MLSSWSIFERIIERKPCLNNAQICKRIFFCKAYRKMSGHEWRQNSIYRQNENRIIWNTPCISMKLETRYQNQFVYKTVKFSGRSLLVCGAIKEDLTRILLRCPPILNLSRYQWIINEEHKDMYVCDCVFMQEGAPCHQSLSTQMCLENQKICYISDCPPQSPDLNTIENI